MIGVYELADFYGGLMLDGQHQLKAHDILNLDKNSRIIAYKYVEEDGRPPAYSNNKIIYRVGKTYSVNKWDDNPDEDCGSGLNVATLRWIRREIYGFSFPVFQVSFKVSDIVCVPHNNGGKIRVKRMRVDLLVDGKVTYYFDKPKKAKVKKPVKAKAKINQRKRKKA